MREIKFRVWDKITKKYFYSGTLDNGDVLVIHLDGEIEISSDDTYKPDDFIIEELTGLLDKNGREIYEGDAVKWYINSRAYLGLVEYVDRFGGFDMRNPGRDGYVCNDWLRGEYEVIGTIHENPELLS